MPRTKEAFEAMRETTRQKIEAAALALFAKNGISVTISEISQAAGLSKGLLYSHYPSKEALIASLVRQATAYAGGKLKDIAQSNNTAIDKIQMITCLMCEILSTSRVGIDYFMFMQQVSMSGFPIQEAISYTESMPNPVECLMQIILAGQSEHSVIDGDPIQLALTYWAAIQGMCCFAVTGVPLSPNPEILSRILLKG